jgi:tRNA threonylcarbamoyl adenosine modification protein (Sua5/YciO/YrdC/YwlC family)
MGQLFVIHPKNPEPRLIKQAVKIIQDGGVVVYPTDSAYAIGCKLENKQAVEHIRLLRQLDEQHYFTLVCKDLSQISIYATIDNSSFRILKAHTPGPYTFVLNATKEVPRRLLHPKRHTIGIRIPDNQIVQALLSELGEPMMSVTLSIPGQDYPMVDARDIYDALGNQVDLVIDGGAGSLEPSTIVEMIDGNPQVVRVGKGDVSIFN